MRKVSNTILIIATALLLFAAVGARAQTTNITNPPSPVAGTPFASINSSDTNWLVIPYLSYDISDKRWGGGAAVLYRVTDFFWAGMRAEAINGSQTTAGIQAQLQVTTKILGVSVTPFIETSVGMGASSIYGSVGPGGVISLYSTSWKWGSGNWSLMVGAAGDYEHVVYGSKNWNQVNAGPMLKISFP